MAEGLRLQGLVGKMADEGLTQTPLSILTSPARRILSSILQRKNLANSTQIGKARFKLRSADSGAQIPNTLLSPVGELSSERFMRLF